MIGMTPELDIFVETCGMSGRVTRMEDQAEALAQDQRGCLRRSDSMQGARVGLGFWIVVLGACGAARGQCPQFDAGQSVGTVAPSQLTELSGIVGSRRLPGVFWVHNDSGDSARIFAIAQTGRLLATCNLSGADAVDYEDIAAGPSRLAERDTGSPADVLYVGDIGDNQAVRSFITVFRLEEPELDCEVTGASLTVPVTRFDLVYEDGPRDAETLLIDPLSDQMLIVTKRDLPARIYTAALPQAPGAEPAVLEYVGSIGVFWPVGGDVSRSGDAVVIRGYSSARFWSRLSGQSLAGALLGSGCSIPLQDEPQGEAICFDHRGCHYFTVSEQSHPPLYEFRRNPPCVETSLRGDLNGDGNVDGTDVMLFMPHWASSGCAPVNQFCSGGDVDLDAVVNLQDAALLFNRVCPMDP